MDRLTRDCIAAQKAGMSYGNYMASQYRAPVIEVDVEPEKTKRVCPVCGKEIPKQEHGSRRYCDERCRYEGGKELTLARYHAKKAKNNPNHERPQRVCCVCGKDIPEYMHGGNRYCSQECRHERDKERHRVEWQKKKDQKRRAKENGEV